MILDGGLLKAALRVRKRRQVHFWRSSPGVGSKAKPGVANKTDPTNGARCVQHVTFSLCLFAFLFISSPCQAHLICNNIFLFVCLSFTTSSCQAGQGCSQSCRPWGKKAPRRGHFSVFIHFKVMEMEIDQIPSFWWRTLYDLQINQGVKRFTWISGFESRDTDWGNRGLHCIMGQLKNIFYHNTNIQVIENIFLFQVQNMTDESQFESLYVYNATILEVANSSRLYSIDI